MPNENLGREQVVSTIANFFSLEDTGVSDEEEIDVGIDRVPGSTIKLIFRHRAQDLLTMIYIYEIRRLPAK